MMKISQERLATFCGILGAIVPECRLMITQDGWNTMAVDTANVAMVSANFPATLFEEYGKVEEEKVEIGMDLQKWKNMLTVMNDKKSIIEIEQQKNAGKIRVSDGKYTYLHVPLDVNTVRKRPTIPFLSLPSGVKVEAKEIQEAIKALGVVGDKAWFTSSIKGGLALDADGDTDHLNKVLTALDGSKFPEAAVSSLFSLDYLADMTKAMKESGTITVSSGQNHPVRFDFEPLEGFECSYLVAPRIEQEDAA